MIQRVAQGVVVAALFSMFSAFQGYRYGVTVTESAQETARLAVQADLFRAGDEISRITAELESAQKAREDMIEGLENEAANDDAVGAPSDDSLRRLKVRWGAP